GDRRSWGSRHPSRKSYRGVGRESLSLLCLANRIRFGWYRPQSGTAPCCRYPVRLQIAHAASKPCGSHNGAAPKCAVSHRVRGCVRLLLADHQRIRGSPLSVGRSDRLGTARVFRTVLKRTLAPCPVPANTLRSYANCSSYYEQPAFYPGAVRSR